ncbi:cytochrome c [Herbaspirillum sp. YR522]|uniref:c-type cytochrome n=1 Tax=Herbaspirillum sp. YR522 TaxID=1144342 RepID=UPI00026F88C4|nr:cytochrome c [Herbaspirillum sp. YR522]EJM96267.1 cytochrome c, mono- and diheme variants family [Herbaspirillum sp. YR522]
MKRLSMTLAGGLAMFVLAGLALLAWQWLRPETMGQAVAITDPAAQVARGAYLARAGNCMGCHTARGSTPYAGGRAMPTPFGTLYTSNLTPDRHSGIGTWNADDFWRALHHGRGKDGRFLYPAFPFTNYTRVSRSDADALFAYLQSLPPAARANTPHQLRFPYNQRWLLGFWRALYFAPGQYQPQPQQGAQWNRGAYLVQGLGHCSGCHSTRNGFGAAGKPDDLSGGLIPGLDWMAPSLQADGPHGLRQWSSDELGTLLANGVSQRAAVMGPMAEVVGQSLQYLTPQDIAAMTTYLRSLPALATPATDRVSSPPQQAEQVMRTGERLYRQLCVDCHNARGQGIAPDYPPLDGNPALAALPVNAIRIVLHGGYPPSTAGNPYPFGMPPFGHQLSDEEVAAVVSYVRNSWSNRGGMVGAAEVNRLRGVPLE